MLVLSRKPGEKIVIDNGIAITVVSVNGNRVRIGIEADDQVSILRGELAFWQKDRKAVESRSRSEDDEVMADAIVF